MDEGHNDATFLLDPALGGAPQSIPSISQYEGYESKDQISYSQPVSHLAPNVSQSIKPRKKNNNANDETENKELKRIAGDQFHLPINELANRVRLAENGPQAERERQIFGISWLYKSCEVSDNANVPRNRIYARYVAVCATEQVKPLNPASFGKLVKMVFPDIKTRRLGVRGQSKYHYCGVGLREGEDSAHDDLSNIGQINLPTAEAEMPTSLLQDELKLKFLPLPPFLQNFTLTDIEPYMPDNVGDDDIAEFAKTYASHCSELIACVRYMKLKKYIEISDAFFSQLSPESQALYVDPCVAQWVQKSDWILYREMMVLLSPLALQVVPPKILLQLETFAASLLSHLQADLCKHDALLRAKLYPATHFIHVVGRLLTVNATAHAASKILNHPADRENILKEWRLYVDGQAIIKREIPCGFEVASRIMSEGLEKLLNPDSSTESVLDLWAEFFEELPNKFPGASPRMFILCLGAVMSASLRSITINGGDAFGTCWVVRCWIDEWVSFLAERGGFFAESNDDDLETSLE